MTYTYSRLLRMGMSGDDVRYMKNCLFSLKYYASNIKKISNSTFGADTLDAVKNYQKSNFDITGKKLDVDGVIGSLTWNSIVAKLASIANPVTEIKFSRMLRKGMAGDDVFYIKKRLFELKYYNPAVKSISSKTFGADTLDAVRKFQGNNNDIYGKKLDVDGVIGSLTWNSIEASYAKLKPGVPITPPAEPIYLTSSDFPNLATKTIADLNSAWKGISQIRIDMMKLCIKHAYDMVNKPYVKGDHLVGMYIIGANLYDTRDNLFIPTAKYIQSRADSRPDFFSGGREAFMLKELEINPKIAASDCSGMLVGAMRKLNLVSNTFDATADTLSTNGRYSVSISKSSLKPGDWVAKSGHIGMYIGAGLVVEFAGGAYGCQITSLANRKLRDLKNGDLEDVVEWTRFRDPVAY